MSLQNNYQNLHVLHDDVLLKCIDMAYIVKLDPYSGDNIPYETSEFDNLAGFDIPDSSGQINSQLDRFLDDLPEPNLRNHPDSAGQTHKLPKYFRDEANIAQWETDLHKKQDEFLLKKREVVDDKVRTAESLFRIRQEQRQSGRNEKREGIIKYDRQTLLCSYEESLTKCEEEFARFELEDTKLSGKMQLETKEAYSEIENAKVEFGKFKTKTKENEKEFEKLLEEVKLLCGENDKNSVCVSNGKMMKVDEGEDGSYIIYNGNLDDSPVLLKDLMDDETLMKVRSLVNMYGMLGRTLKFTIKHGDFVTIISTKNIVELTELGIPTLMGNKNPHIIGIGYGKTDVESVESGLNHVYNEMFVRTPKKGIKKEVINNTN